MQTAIYKIDGTSQSKTNLNEAVFGVKANPQVLAQAVKVQLANHRNAIAHTKTRGEVSGGGRKPYKQKGTGNARAGSTRSPLWTGGGVTFGPRNVQNFSLRLPQKMRQAAIKMALSQKLAEKHLIILQDLDLPKISTKSVADILQKLPLEQGKILVILSKINVNFELSAANIPYMKLIKADNLNVVDLLNYEYILSTTDGLKRIEEIFGKNK